VVLRAAIILLLVMAVPAQAASRATRIAMAVALLDVAEQHCDSLKRDADLEEHLLRHFHEYDIGGLASAISGPLNSFYEDFEREAKADASAFCRAAPAYAAQTGYPVIVSAE
jgi:hypothetical protein